MIGSMIQASVIGAVYVYMDTLNAPAAAHKRTLQALKRYINHRMLDSKLAERLIAYHEHEWFLSKGRDEFKIFKQLPMNFQREVKKKML